MKKTGPSINSRKPAGGPAAWTKIPFSKTCFRRKAAFAAGIGLVLSTLLLAPGARAKSLTWTGGGANNYWSSSANWGPQGVPANGDVLYFPFGAARLVNTNNLTDLRLASITFPQSATNYAIWGNSLTLSNGFVLLYTLGTVRFYPPISLGANQTWDFTAGSSTASFVCAGNIDLQTYRLTVNNRGTVVLDCAISGSGGVTKGTYPGILSFYGLSGFSKRNSYTGTTYVYNGTLELRKVTATAIAGDLVIGSSGGIVPGVVRLFEDNQIATASHVTINGGLLDLNGYLQAIGGLSMTGGHINNTSAGLLTLTADVTATSSSGSTYYPGAEISGPVSLNGTDRTFTVGNGPQNNDLILWGEVRGGGTLGGIIKEGAGHMVLVSSNSYSGFTHINAGDLSIENNYALGDTYPGTYVAAGASLGVWAEAGPITTGEALNLAGNGPAGAGALIVWKQCTFLGYIMLTADAVVNNGPTASDALTVLGEIAGPGGLTKVGAGTLYYAYGGGNHYTGTTRVNEGKLYLEGNVIPGFGGPLVVGDATGSSGVVRAVGFRQLPGSQPVTINPGGLLDLGSSDQMIGPLTMNGGRITNAPGGLLTLAGDVTATSVAAGVYPRAEIFGTVSLNGTNRIFTVNNGPDPNDLTLNGEVSNGGIVKNGSGTLMLTASNSYAGPTLINEGNLSILNTWALGATSSGTVVAGSAGLWVGGAGLAGQIWEPLTMGGLDSWLVFYQACTWAGPVGLTDIVDIYCTESNYTATISGPISGSGGFTKYGPGILRLAGSSDNLYYGPTAVNEGILELAKTSYWWAIGHGSLTIGDGMGGYKADVVRYASTGTDQIYNAVPITIRSSGLLDLNGHSDTVGAIHFRSGSIVTGDGLLSLSQDVTAEVDGASDYSELIGHVHLGSTRMFAVSNAGVLSIQADLTGSGGLTLTGPGYVSLRGSNSYPGLTRVSVETLVARGSYCFGTTNSGTTVTDGAGLYVIGDSQVNGETLTLGSGEGGSPLLSGQQGTNTWNGPITLASSARVFVWDTNSLLRIPGPISGPGGFVKFGSGALELAGASANTYSGDTSVTEGVLELNKTVVDGAIPGKLIIGDGIGGTNTAVVRALHANQIANSSDVTVRNDGLLDFGANVDAIDGLDGVGNLTADNYLGLGYGNGSSAFYGVVSGTGALRKEGSGTITLNGASPFAGSTTVGNGKLAVNGSLSQSPVTVLGSGTLAGRGTVGTLIGSGNVSPGASPGILTCSNLTFSASGNFFVELTGPAPGTGYDQLNVRGTNNLGNAVLQVAPSFTSPVSLGDQFVIVNNDGTESITGTFSGLANGATFSADGFGFRITYNGGTGNDVVLTLVDLPAAAGTVTITTGNGNHAIDPNECNLLALVISNQTATPMTGVTAILSSPDPGVMITQPYSDYPDVPALTGRTNATPFQIATLPNFPCGAKVHLELMVRSASHGQFVVPVVLYSGEPSLWPKRFDVSTTTNIPDVGTTESTNLVAGFAGPLTKVGVSLWLTHPWDADLNISLVSPDGVVVDLTSGNGAGPNFGATCSPDASRTTFDDAAAMPITAGSPPFIGAFRPEGSLAAFIGGTVNGNWRLRVSDNLGGTLGALRCWSLFLYPIQCALGGGFCDVCLPGITGAISAADPVQNGRVARDSVPASCGSPKAWPGLVATNFHYDVYTFTNLTGADACVTVHLQAAGDVQAAAYLNTFDPANIHLNYVGDSGESTGTAAGHTAFSCTVPAGASFLVTVNEVVSSAGTIPYTLYLSGLPCPPPTLAIAPADAPNKVRVHWPTWAGDYQLRSQTSLTGPAWNATLDEPIVSAGRFNVTNTTAGTNRFYRLYRQQ